jgi:hypothetical protein
MNDPFIEEKIQAMVQGSKAFEDGLPRKSPHEYKSGLEYVHRAWLDGWDRGKFDMNNGLVHVAGRLIERVQRCIICGEILTDLRNACYAIMPGEPHPVDAGWPEGYVTVVKSNGRTDYSAGETKRVPHCSPL